MEMIVVTNEDTCQNERENAHPSGRQGEHKWMVEGI